MYRNGLLSVCLLWSGISLADCDMDNWVRDAADAWENNGVVQETLCYVELLDAMDLETALEYGRQYDEELQRRRSPGRRLQDRHPPAERATEVWPERSVVRHPAR